MAATGEKAHLQVYRNSVLGSTLMEALNALHDNMSDEGREAVMLAFDQHTCETLSGQGSIFLRPENGELKDWYERTRVGIKGHLNMFRGVDNVWTLLVENASLKVEPGNGEEIKVDALKIFAVKNEEEVGKGKKG